MISNENRRQCLFWLAICDLIWCYCSTQDIICYANCGFGRWKLVHKVKLITNKLSGQCEPFHVTILNSMDIQMLNIPPSICRYSEVGIGQVSGHLTIWQWNNLIFTTEWIIILLLWFQSIKISIYSSEFGETFRLRPFLYSRRFYRALSKSPLSFIIHLRSIQIWDIHKICLRFKVS